MYVEYMWSVCGVYEVHIVNVDFRLCGVYVESMWTIVESMWTLNGMWLSVKYRKKFKVSKIIYKVELTL